MARTWFLLAVTLAVGPLSCVEAQPAPIRLQRIVIVAEHQGATQGVLYRLEGSGASWQQVGGQVPVVFGRGGVGPKVEGDGRSPQGVFELGAAFGYGEAAPPELQIAYLPLAPETVCVDDPDSPEYNRIVNTPPSQSDGEPEYRSAEQMRRDLAFGDGLYEHGVVIQYNTEGRRDPSTGKGLGSCIFLHVWRSDSSPTAGCTAMAKNDLLALLGWLDPDQEPRVVQGSRTFLEAMTRDGTLPFPIPDA